MHPDKAPGPDGFNPAFYQRFWPLLGNDVYQTCSKWLNMNAIPQATNETIITLIPKIDCPTTMKDFRPISLCNVLYKIMAKVLANRLKLLLPSIINESQSAFVPRRSITDNVIATFEVIHHMKRKSQSNVGEVALKIDISKAYDRIKWGYLRAIMLKMGFVTQWVD